MAAISRDFSPVPMKKGFKKWVKLSLDDLPLIRPPKHHMVVQMTGGLTNLYKSVVEDKKSKGNTDPDVPSKSDDQLQLEKPDVVRISFVKFFTDKKAEEDENKLLKEQENQAIKERKEEEKEKVNGEDLLDEDNKENKINGEVKDGEEEESDCEDKKSDDGKKKIENGGKTDEKEQKDVDKDKKSDKDENESSDEKMETDNNKKKDDADKNMKDLDKDEKEDGDKGDDNKSVSDKADDEGGGENKKDEEAETKKDDEESKNVEDKMETEEDKKNSCEKEGKLNTTKTDDDSDEEEEDEEEEEETTAYTDEDGEFVPLADMPLLAGRYKYLQVLGRGQSALIIKAEDTFCRNRPLAIKVLHRVYKPIGSQEADILLELHRADPYLHVPFARIKTQFLYGPHYCLVFEALSPTPLYTHYDQRDIRGSVSLPYIRQLAVKLLTVMGFLNKQNVIHADLKPENILLAKEDDLNSIMVVDFGNALRNTEEELSLYYSDFELQTLLYRAPEVIFGLRFSLEVDMWSLGCLLAECYIGKPLFMGKTKHDILSKMSKLLGPFPKEFSEGECGGEFAEFIGRPLSRYQRMQNLSKRLNKCTDVHFLMLIEKMLTYLPERRMVPAEAACHPFVAYINPFLYLTPSPGLLRYPTVVLDMTTYPFLPEAVDEESEDKFHKRCRKRLLSYSHPIKPAITDGKINGSSANNGSSGVSHNNNNNNSNVTTTTTADSVLSINKENKTVNVSSTSSSQLPVSRSDVKDTLKSMGLRCEDFTISVYSKEQAHAILRKQGVEVTNHTPSGSSSSSRQYHQQQQQQQQQQQRHNHQQQQQQQQYNHHQMNQRGGNNRNVRSGAGSGNVQGYRSSVSIGRPPLSQSRNAAPRMSGSSGGGGSQNSGGSRSHGNTANNQDDDDDDCVILDPPENPRSQPPPARVPAPQPRLPQQFQLMGTTVQVNRGAKRPYSGPQNPIAPKRSSRGPYNYHQMQQQQQQQQQNNPYQQMPQQRYSSRQIRHQQQLQQQYMDDYSDEDSGGESSVQDTLKRLKNYNISITCRRNEPSYQRNMGGNRHMSVNRNMGNMAANYHHHGGNIRSSGNMRSGNYNMNRAHHQNVGRNEAMNMMRGANMMRSDSDYDDEHPMDSEEDTEADMAKYLECEIGEDENMMGAHMGMVEGDEELHFGEDDEDDMGAEDYMPQGRMMGQPRHHHPHQQQRHSYMHGHRGTGNGGHFNREKGKSTHPHQPPKRIVKRNEIPAVAADTSIEEVTLSKDSEGEYDNRARKQHSGDEQEKEDDGELNSREAEEAAAAAEQDDNVDGDDAADGSDGEDQSKLVDNLLERHLNAVCGSSSPNAGENEDEDDGENNPEEDKDADEAKSRGGSSKKSTPMNSKDNSRGVSPAENSQKNSQPTSPVNEGELLGEDADNDDDNSKDAMNDEATESKDKARNVEAKEGEDDEIDEELEKELLGGDDDL
uniref:Dual specificity tyrosine-phosphorylation-regulated kinase 1A-like isoform X3 n=1 Tax=Hirondellea gigas TaxID=1518452 RepID=A0A6A7FT26_9CRUS